MPTPTNTTEAPTAESRLDWVAGRLRSIALEPMSPVETALFECVAVLRREAQAQAREPSESAVDPDEARDALVFVREVGALARAHGFDALWDDGVGSWLSEQLAELSKARDDLAQARADALDLLRELNAQHGGADRWVPVGAFGDTVQRVCSYARKED